MRKGNKNGFLKDVLRGLCFAALVSFISILIFALIIKETSVSDKGILIGNTVIKVLSVALGVIFGVKCAGRSALKGITVGLSYAALVYLFTSVFNNDWSMSVGNAIDVATVVIVGFLAGVIVLSLRGDAPVAEELVKI